MNITGPDLGKTTIVRAQGCPHPGSGELQHADGEFLLRFIESPPPIE